MKRRGLLVVTALVLLLTCVVLARAAVRAPGPAGIVRSRDHTDGATLVRFRQGQPSHWRACLLQP